MIDGWPRDLRREILEGEKKAGVKEGDVFRVEDATAPGGPFAGSRDDYMAWFRKTSGAGIVELAPLRNGPYGALARVRLRSGGAIELFDNYGMPAWRAVPRDVELRLDYGHRYVHLSAKGFRPLRTVLIMPGEGADKDANRIVRGIGLQNLVDLVEDTFEHGTSPVHYVDMLTDKLAEAQRRRVLKHARRAARDLLGGDADRLDAWMRCGICPDDYTERPGMMNMMDMIVTGMLDAEGAGRLQDGRLGNMAGVLHLGADRTAEAQRRFLDGLDRLSARTGVTYLVAVNEPAVADGPLPACRAVVRVGNRTDADGLRQTTVEVDGDGVEASEKGRVVRWLD